MLFFELLIQSPVIVDIRGGNAGGEISKLTQFATAFELFSRGIIFVAGLATFVYMIWGAVDWILAGGDEGKITSARQKITQSIIGLTVLVSVGAIFLALQYFLGIHVLDSGAAAPAAIPTPSQTCILGFCF
ncbi:MAG: hypothetical protein ABI425_03070 [Patescibacteria group bacterium]